MPNEAKSLLATMINEETLDMIAKLNDGVRPTTEEIPTFFIVGADATSQNTIVTANDFFATYDVGDFFFINRWNLVTPK